MSNTTLFADGLRIALTKPTRGIIGLVDDLLALCGQHSLQLEWRTDCCRIRPAGGDWEELPDIHLRRSVFRAVLARVAALCNERSPNSVTPYGGESELSAGANCRTLLQVAFANTPSEQRLALTTKAGATTDTCLREEQLKAASGDEEVRFADG
jgi:hypothetical protein